MGSYLHSNILQIANKFLFAIMCVARAVNKMFMVNMEEKKKLAFVIKFTFSKAVQLIYIFIGVKKIIIFVTLISMKIILHYYNITKSRLHMCKVY